MKITDERKKEIDKHDNRHVWYFRNMYTDEDWQYICETRDFLVKHIERK